MHCYGGHHVGWLLLENEGVERPGVDGLVADNIGCDILAPAGVVEGLDGDVPDAGVVADDAFHLFELDAETTDFHLAVAPSYKLYVA